MFTSLKSFFNKMAVIIVIGLTAFCFYQAKQINKLDTELSQVTNNYEYYRSRVDVLGAQNRVLQLSISDLNYSNDSLLQNLQEVKEQLKIKDKNIAQVQVIKTEVKDTVFVKVNPDTINFSKKLELNPLTTIIVSRKDSILSASLELYNKQTLFVEEKKRYRNQYKNFFQRLIHFDFKKDRIKNYQIHNSNELIKVTDTRVVEVQ